jgi:hypothetical protein
LNEHLKRQNICSANEEKKKKDPPKKKKKKQKNVTSSGVDVFLRTGGGSFFGEGAITFALSLSFAV